MLYFGEVLAMRGTPQTIVANFVNTSRQHMLQKTADELLGDDGHGFGLIVPGILTPKDYLARSHALVSFLWYFGQLRLQQE